MYVKALGRCGPVIRVKLSYLVAIVELLELCDFCFSCTALLHQGSKEHISSSIA